jgi:peptide/nickel transport system substrate-binding protein
MTDAIPKRPVSRRHPPPVPGRGRRAGRAHLFPIVAWAQDGRLNVRAYLEPDDYDPLDASGFLEECSTAASTAS